jgi:hypothetical protein
MREQLEEITAKAARQPASYPDLTLLYQRGHDLSGITRFEMQAGGAFALSAGDPRHARQASFEGQLEASQRAAVLSAVEEAKLLRVPSSTRPIGDDELPIIVEMRYDDLHHRLLIWAGDARHDADFQRFEQALWVVLKDLGGDEIGRAPAASG